MLSELGEVRILRELIAPRFGGARSNAPVGFGDDAAILEVPGTRTCVAITTDPCPTPVLCMVDPRQRDFFHYGWMTVVINLSDLAAMGASPGCMVVSTIMAERMRCNDYARFLDGAKEASETWDCPILGGNIKDGAEFSATGTAIGFVDRDRVMRRAGARQGDLVLVVGTLGMFWTAVLARMRPDLCPDGPGPEATAALERPVPRIREGALLAASGCVTACMDSSDGVVACLRELASLGNRTDIVVESAALRPCPALPPLADVFGLDIIKVLLSWGDWQLVCTVTPSQINHITDLLNRMGCPSHIIGEVTTGSGQVRLKTSGSKTTKLPDFSSARFCESSFFSHGLGAYLRLLRSRARST